MKRILLPLDGAPMSEAVLPAATLLARKLEATLILLHILEQRAPTTVHGERHLSQAAESDAYLVQLAERLTADGLSVEKHVHESPEGDVARSIAAHADELGSDLVALCTHGQGHLRDLLWGNIAQQVLCHGQQPVLLVPPAATSDPVWQLERILVPLDGTAAHEPALPVAQGLARGSGARLLLVMVIPTAATLRPKQAATGLLMPMTMRAVLDLAEQGARDYLARTANDCAAAGVTAEALLHRGEVGPGVVTAATNEAADLVIMATHGRSGIDAWLEQGVAASVLPQVRCPLLLLQAGEH